MGKRVYGYVRVSEMRPPPKGENGEKPRETKFSPEAQRQAIIKEAERLDLPVTDFFEDLNVNSAHMEEAGTFDKLLATVSEGDTVITVDFSRIGRDQLETLQRVASLIDRGCEIISLEQRFDMSGVYAKAIVGFMTGIAEADNTLRGLKIKAAAREKIKAGRWTGGPLPYGYRYGERPGEKLPLPVEIDEAKAEAIRNIFERGPCNRREKGIIRNRAYISEREYEGEVYPLDFPPIISSEEWEKAQGTPHPRHALSGKLTCSLCGGRMVHKPSRTNPQWVCYGRKGIGNCKGVGISDKVLDDFIGGRDVDRIVIEPGRGDRVRIEWR